MKFNRPLIAAAYAVAALMILFPIIELTMSVWPLRAGEPSWRFGTLGLVSQAAMTPIVGAVLLMATAFTLGHRKTLVIAGIVAGLVALVLIIGLPLFALDAIQMRTQVRQQSMRAFDLSGVLAFMKLSGVVVVAILMSIGAIKAGREGKRRAAVAREPEPLLHRQ